MAENRYVGRLIIRNQHRHLPTTFLTDTTPFSHAGVITATHFNITLRRHSSALDDADKIADEPRDEDLMPEHPIRSSARLV